MASIKQLVLNVEDRAERRRLVLAARSVKAPLAPAPGEPWGTAGRDWSLDLPGEMWEKVFSFLGLSAASLAMTCRRMGTLFSMLAPGIRARVPRRAADGAILEPAPGSFWAEIQPGAENADALTAVLDMAPEDACILLLPGVHYVSTVLRLGSHHIFGRGKKGNSRYFAGAHAEINVEGECGDFSRGQYAWSGLPCALSVCRFFLFSPAGCCPRGGRECKFKHPPTPPGACKYDLWHEKGCSFGDHCDLSEGHVRQERFYEPERNIIVQPGSRGTLDGVRIIAPHTITCSGVAALTILPGSRPRFQSIEVADYSEDFHSVEADSAAPVFTNSTLEGSMSFRDCCGSVTGCDVGGSKDTPLRIKGPKTTLSFRHVSFMCAWRGETVFIHADVPASWRFGTETLTFWEGGENNDRLIEDEREVEPRAGAAKGRRKNR